MNFFQLFKASSESFFMSGDFMSGSFGLTRHGYIFFIGIRSQVTARPHKTKKIRPGFELSVRRLSSRFARDSGDFDGQERAEEVNWTGRARRRSEKKKPATSLALADVEVSALPIFLSFFLSFFRSRLLFLYLIIALSFPFFICLIFLLLSLFLSLFLFFLFALFFFPRSLCLFSFSFLFYLSISLSLSLFFFFLFLSLFFLSLFAPLFFSLCPTLSTSA
jgi:hypothetical protein